MNDNEIRWRQIFDNYDKAFIELNHVKDRIFENNLEKAGYIHYFEIAFNLANRVMFAYLEAKERFTEDYHLAVKELAGEGIIRDSHTWYKVENRKKLPLFLHKNEMLFDELIYDITETYIPEFTYFWERLKEIR
ncbi:nucleotidyltransferase substrate binding protein [Salirhabdus sp. Marseille-P4669]|uniref:nucleotidyltransferase substrate binding protein n=1 Tax=Salirhabdus sp. Marseille-P4669 TaxID=2042310 RepID=UPI00135B31A7|nr:nucleotidyltransferase substrate binding protein [Salirhabdus sp. Marseille-P4669]